jgi:hypothetical protein
MLRAALCASFLLALAASLIPRPASAAGTDPLLALDGARAFATADGTATLEVSGRFSFDDLLQFSFPAGLIVWRGATWVRYGLDGGVTTGTEPALANGITAEEATELLDAGAAAGPPAAVLRVAPSRISVVLPASFGAGPATVVVYAVLDEETFLSNALGVAVP